MSAKHPEEVDKSLISLTMGPSSLECPSGESDYSHRLVLVLVLVLVLAPYLFHSESLGWTLDVMRGEVRMKHSATGEGERAGALLLAILRREAGKRPLIGETLCSNGDENPTLSEGANNREDCLGGMNDPAFRITDDMLAD